MISVIICSRTPAVSDELRANIHETIGDVPYEIIIIDNSRNKYSIFSAYNSGARQSKYSFLCFMHGDVKIHSSAWGHFVMETFANYNIGVLGVAGSMYISKTPSPWWFSDLHKQYWRSFIIQHYKNKIIRPDLQVRKESKIVEVVVVDGVWLCCKKQVWERVSFDDRSYNGFHFYDLDLSMALIKEGYKNYITPVVSIEHYSSGTLNLDWIHSALIFNKKWKNVLPVRVGEMEGTQVKIIEEEVLRNWLLNMNLNAYPGHTIWVKYWLKHWKLSGFKRFTYSLLYHRMKLILNV